MEAFNGVRRRIWSCQPEEFFDEAKTDADGTLLETLGECKEGMHISYKGTWGFHPLVVSLANTQEPLFLVNRGGNRPSSERASERLDQAIELCRRSGFKKVTLRGDTDFTQTKHLDGDVLRFLSKKNDVWFPKLKPVPVMGTEKENHTSWEKYYRGGCPGRC